MESKGRLIDVSKDWHTGKFRLTFEIDSDVSGEVGDLANHDLRVKAVRWRKKRSLDANAMLWACIGDLAAALDADKWEVYLLMLKRYGKFTYICVKPNVVEAVKEQWRECEVIGTVDVNGMEAVQLLCYFGSSTYDSKEFSRLLNGVVAEMKEVGIPLPPPKDVEQALEYWQKTRGRKDG